MNNRLPLILALLSLQPSTTLAAETGQEPPQCEAVMANNQQTLDLNTYKGKVVLIDFWATWCPPCKKSMPFLNSFRNEKQKEGFEIIAINVDENTEEAKQFLTNNPVDYPIAFDSKGSCPSVFDVKAMPSSYLVDKSGKIRLVHLGFRDGDETIIREHVTQLLAE